MVLARRRRSKHSNIFNMNLVNKQNPQNWPTPKKLLVSSVMILLTAVFSMGGPLGVAGKTSIAETFGVSDVVATLSLTTYLAGYGIGNHTESLRDIDS